MSYFLGFRGRLRHGCWGMDAPNVCKHKNDEKVSLLTVLTLPINYSTDINNRQTCTETT